MRFAREMTPILSDIPHLSTMLIAMLVACVEATRQKKKKSGSVFFSK